MKANDVLELCGNTPLVKINKLTEGAYAEVYAKTESSNPGFCVKDRIAKAMIDDAIANGTLKPGMTVIEPTSGNTGIGLAMTCAVRGYKLILCMPDSMSVERRQLMRIFGAELVLTPGADGMKGAINKAAELAEDIDGAWIPQQFENASNPAIHEKTTAKEIIADMNGDFDYFVAGVGTGGTVTGCARTFKKEVPNVKIVAVEPETSAVLSGEGPGKHKIQGIGAGFIPGVMEPELLDEVIKVSDEQSGETARQLAQKEGILCGISCGASMTAALELAKRPENKGKKIVCILPDTGERYLSTWLFEDYKM
ncbi:cysteine synthase [Lentisphaera araneosa HTCC2155]|jgi:cysteine synthase|uniref:cysteine synthase n=1 Tax=Lentisphaera araneosa HTCC2155 TaxID=313628 RepID=A6DH61_9BACT|nr:cysteine synthase A [Lentisphaera araneosa]EDM28944.1 cysteine synthase [Lentisphaera araneosa HTCC2155]